MAIYTTFFLCEPENLAAGFPGWRLPLAVPIKREFNDPFTGRTEIFETRKPDWDDVEDPDVTSSDCSAGSRLSPFAWLRGLFGWPARSGFTVRVINGDYNAYLNERVLPFVQERPHWATKGLTQSELEPLAETLGLNSRFENPLYAHRELASELVEIPAELVNRLAGLSDPAVSAAAQRWAVAMSAPEHTHSSAGTRINEGWTEDDAMIYLQPLVNLSRQVPAVQTMYLLIEA